MADAVWNLAFPYLHGEYMIYLAAYNGMAEEPIPYHYLDVVNTVLPSWQNNRTHFYRASKAYIILGFLWLNLS